MSLHKKQRDCPDNSGQSRSLLRYVLIDYCIIPVFLTKHVNIIPYISVFGNAGGQASQLTGFNINFGNGIPWQGKTTLANGFGLGMDWLQSMGKWTSPNYFVYGTLDIKFFKGIFTPRTTGTQRIL